MKLPIARFKVVGNSMMPTLKPGQDLISFNWFINPKIGDLVVVQVGGKEMIKRVHYIHGREVIVQGDNLLESTDSRHFGAVNIDQVVGKVIYHS